MGIIPGGVSKYDRADPKTVNIRTKTRTLPQVFMLKKIEVLMILALIQLLLSTITKKVRPKGFLQI